MTGRIDESQQAASLDPSKTGIHESPRKALEKVGFYYEGWSTNLTESSTQMCYGLIGANWVVFGSVGGILNSIWAKWSLFAVILTLGCNVIGAWYMTESLRIDSNGQRDIVLNGKRNSMMPRERGWRFHLLLARNSQLRL